MLRKVVTDHGRDGRRRIDDDSGVRKAHGWPEVLHRGPVDQALRMSECLVDDDTEFAGCDRYRADARRRVEELTGGIEPAVHRGQSSPLRHRLIGCAAALRTGVTWPSGRRGFCALLRTWCGGRTVRSRRRPADTRVARGRGGTRA